jgi:hypothetical protein
MRIVVFASIVTAMVAWYAIDAFVLPLTNANIQDRCYAKGFEICPADLRTIERCPEAYRGNHSFPGGSSLAQRLCP